jgi:hypothetical protein
VTILYVELAVLILALVGVMVVFWVAHNRLLGKVYDRQRALDGYAKAATRESLATLRSAESVLAEVAHVRDDTRLIQQRVEQHLRGNGG